MPSQMEFETDYNTSICSSINDCSSMDSDYLENFNSTTCEQSQSETIKDMSKDTIIEDKKKGKILSMQRMALDSIFAIVDRPSRGLVLHIAAELNLHYVTAKNFFSNGRRRMRRATARLKDPDRTIRENQRRKEKRRLTALAKAASKEKCIIGNCHGLLDMNSNDNKKSVLSSKRKYLMEKLAVKIHKNASQKAMLHSFQENLDSLNTPETAISLDMSAIGSRGSFSVMANANNIKPFNLVPYSKSKILIENKTNKVCCNKITTMRKSDTPSDYYLSDLCQKNYYAPNELFEEEYQQMLSRLGDNYSSPKWQPSIYS